MQLRSLLLCCLLVTAAVPAWAEPVDSVQVRITDNGGTSGVLLDRMSRSMQVVAEQLFLDKDSVNINAARGTASTSMPRAVITSVCWQKWATAC